MTMASIPTQEEVLAATRKSQEAMMATVKSWFDAVRTTTPKLPRLPQVGLPFAGKLPTPQEAVANAYHLAEQLLASQRKFAEDLVAATAPLWAGHSKSSPEVPSRNAWHSAVADTEPKTPAVSAAPKAVVSTAPKPAESTAPKVAESTAPKVAESPTPKAVDSPAPKAAPGEKAAKSTTARTTSHATAAKRTTAGSASTTGSTRKSTATTSRKSTAAGSTHSTRKSAGTTSPAPKDTDAR
jgi:hypothetical protein